MSDTRKLNRANKTWNNCHKQMLEVGFLGKCKANGSYRMPSGMEGQLMSTLWLRSAPLLPLVMSLLILFPWMFACVMAYPYSSCANQRVPFIQGHS